LGILPSWVSAKKIEEGSKDSHYESALKCPDTDEREKSFRLVTDLSALVGEVGLDCSASLMSGTSVQLKLARQLNRAVSTHCVQNLQKKGDKSCVRLCIHSFGGSPGTIPQFMSLIKAIPDDRILLKSDVNNSDSLDNSLMAISHKVGTAKGWTIEKVVQQTHSNWTEF
ncbi:hypothetical protein CLU79DRAFT_762077, partial [Phycomyces nitens]